KALALVWENIKTLNRATLAEADKIFGLGLTEVRLPQEIPAEIQKLADAREAARKNKDFARSDTLRAQIESKGFIVKDSPTGPQISSK
ncbi:MAG: cysteine--tRNA ligase, partial [Patescibacteria group bacterium]|nr:cysteine--tRNA ligase [Patescibacteria group bacterium]